MCRIFPPMSPKDRAVGLAFMSIYALVAYAPLIALYLIVMTGYSWVLIPDEVLRLALIGVSAPCGCAFAFGMIGVGRELCTHPSPSTTDRRGLYPDDKQAWKHGGDW